MKKILCLFIMAFALVLTGCGSKEESKNKNEEKYSDLPDVIETCLGCVYVYTSNHIRFLPNNQTKLYEDDYYTNWKDVVKESGYNTFLGLVLDSKNNVEKAYVCGLENNIPFCLEGSLSDYYDGNKSIRDEIFNKNFEVLKMLCDASSSCVIEDTMEDVFNDVPSSYVVEDTMDASFRGNIKSRILHNGQAHITDGNSSCSVYESGFAVCDIRN